MKTETAQVLDFPRQTTQAVSEEPETPLQPTVRPPMQYIEKMLAGSEYLKLNFKILREGIGHYVNGASDEAGAEECHLTLEQFTEFRRQQCGELVDYGALKLLVSTLGTDIEALQTTLSGEVTKLQDMLGNNETPDRKLLQDFVAAEQIKVGQMLTKMREDIDRSVATLQKDADGYFEKLLADGDVHLKDLEAKRTATAKVQLEGLTDRIDEVNVLQKRLSDISSSLPA